MLRNTTRCKRPCPEQDGAALLPGPQNGSAKLAREVSAPAASRTRGNTPQADTPGSTSASLSPSFAPVAHGRESRHGLAQRDERSACDAAQPIAHSDTTFRRAPGLSAAVEPYVAEPGSQATGEGEVSLVAPEKSSARERQDLRKDATATKEIARVPRIPPPTVTQYDQNVHSDVAALVDAIFLRQSPVDVSVRLLASDDERIAEKHLDLLYQMRYGKPATAAPVAEEPPTIVIDVPRPDYSGKV